MIQYTAPVYRKKAKKGKTSRSVSNFVGRYKFPDELEVTDIPLRDDLVSRLRKIRPVDVPSSDLALGKRLPSAYRFKQILARVRRFLGTTGTVPVQARTTGPRSTHSLWPQTVTS